MDDDRAHEIAARLQAWGAALFSTVFAAAEARRLVNRFQDRAEAGSLLTIDSGHPAVLGQPWELLCDPNGTYLLHEEQRISVRRRLVGAGGGRAPFRRKAKERLHLLFVVSRPDDANFIDQRAYAHTVMDASTPRRWAGFFEFLRRPRSKGCGATGGRASAGGRRAAFRGHGAYDADGALAAERSDGADAGGEPGGAGRSCVATTAESRTGLPAVRETGRRIGPGFREETGRAAAPGAGGADGAVGLPVGEGRRRGPMGKIARE